MPHVGDVLFYQVKRSVSANMNLRPYQTELKHAVYSQWAAGAPNVLAVLPTGGGKTVIFSDITREHNGHACAIAHRQELVGQISLALARDKVRHRIIAPGKVIRLINRIQVEELGTSYYHPNAAVGVAGVDTLLRRADSLRPWLNSITLWTQDEAHHVLRDNKWGKAAQLFPNAKGLGVTATPLRADGKGLGRHADGLFDTLVEGSGMRELVRMGYLTDYRIYAPPSDIDLSAVRLSADGDYSRPGLKAAVRKSRVVGDVVKHYLRIAPGKLGVTFATDVETATDIAAQFNAAGVPAEIVSAKTPDADRVAILRRFKNRQLLQLVNVNLFCEGFDLAAIEVVSMARPTQSFGLYAQQFGRALRIMDGKQHAIIIDHVGNVQRHGLPDSPRVWSLDRREKRSRGGADDAIPVRACLNTDCLAVYERVHPTCPFCGYAPEPASRSGPEFVDGDLCELDPATLAAMRGEADRLTLTPEEFLAQSKQRHMGHVIAKAAMNRHDENRKAQEILRETIAYWAGVQRAMNRPDRQSYRLFYYRFGIDVLSAQALKAREAEALTIKIAEGMK